MTISQTIQSDWDNLSGRAQQRIRMTRPQLVRQWELIEEGYGYDTIEADSAAAALNEAIERVDGDNYPDRTETMWIEVCVRNKVTGETAESTVTVHPDEPKCDSAEGHDWQSPYQVLGGIRENPGVWGHGGGVIVKTVCAHCGQYKAQDSWAQNPSNGVQGLDSVRYEEADEKSQRWIVQLALEPAQEALRAAGYETEIDDDHAVLRLTIDGNDEDESETTLMAIREQIGADFRADFSGNGNTDQYGDSTWNIVVERA